MSEISDNFGMTNDLCMSNQLVFNQDGPYDDNHI